MIGKPARERLTLIRVFEELWALGYEGGTTRNQRPIERRDRRRRRRTAEYEAAAAALVEVPPARSPACAPYSNTSPSSTPGRSAISTSGAWRLRCCARLP